MGETVKVAFCDLCQKELVDSFTEQYCVTCDGEWYCFVKERQKDDTECLFEEGPQYVYATKNLIEARVKAGFAGYVCAVRRFGSVPIDREYGAWFSIYATFERWVERTQHQVRGTLPPSTPDPGQSF